jgi:hypothetical protein
MSKFQLAETKSAKDFAPNVGATLPQGLVPDGFPNSVIGQLPQLRDYAYLKIERPGSDRRCDQPQDCRHVFGNTAVNLKRLTPVLNQFGCFDLL